MYSLEWTKSFHGNMGVGEKRFRLVFFIFFGEFVSFHVSQFDALTIFCVRELP